MQKGISFISNPALKRSKALLFERLNGSVGGIIAGLRNCEARAEDAYLILSTAHKSKGAQRRTVKLSEEFQNIWEAAKVIDKDNEAGVRPPPDGEDLEIQYVAATRAERLLAHRGLLTKAKEHIRMVRTTSVLR